jgi:hypothetical protein
MDREDALKEVRRMIDGDRRLIREIGRYADRTGMDREAAVDEVAERMYLSMTKQ